MWFGPPNLNGRDPAQMAADARLLRHARKRIDQGKFSYAAGYLRMVVRHAPGRLDVRKLLRRAEFQAFEHGQTRLGTAVFVNMENRNRLTHAKLSGDWELVAEAAEDFLLNDPTDVEIHIELGNSFRERGMRKHALFAFECAYELMPLRYDIRETIESLLDF